MGAHVQCTGCAWRRHPGLQSNADNIQGVFGKVTLVQFAGHCNQVDVIPILEWTQVSVALGGFCGFILDSEMGLLDFPGLESCWSW